MAVSQTSRIPQGGHVFRTPGWFIRNTSLEDTVASISKLFPAWFLPIIAKDPNRDVPFVMFPGTIVGTLNARDHSALVTKFGAQSPNIMVPASQAATYKLGYSAYDLATDEYGGTYDIDGADDSTLVTATGLSTDTIAKVRPLGIVQECVIGRQYFRRHRNLEQQTKINLLVAGKVFRMPAVTAEELLIHPGDRVMVSDTAGDWDPIANPTTSYPGRIKRCAETAANQEFVIGRCIERHQIIAQTTPNAGAMLLTDYQAGLLNAGSLNQQQDYHILKRIQTVPGLYLQGSGSGGVPSALSFARADAAGGYYALDIQIGF